MVEPQAKWKSVFPKVFKTIFARGVLHGVSVPCGLRHLFSFPYLFLRYCLWEHRSSCLHPRRLALGQEQLTVIG
jgi:hypothetical protein